MRLFHRVRSKRFLPFSARDAREFDGLETKSIVIHFSSAHTPEMTNTDQSLQQKQHESDDKQDDISSHGGLKDQVLEKKITDEEPHKQQEEEDDLENLRCDDEEDLKEQINEAEQGEVDTYLRNQLGPLIVTSLDANQRATIIDCMLGCAEAESYPLAPHLAVMIFDSYFATFSLDEARKALSPHTVLSCAFAIAKKHIYYIDFSEQDQRMQFQILNPIQYKVNIPTTINLVDAVLESTGSHPRPLKFLCSYLTELQLLDRSCSGFQIHVLAAAAFFVGQFIFYSSVPKVRVPWECDDQLFRDAVTIVLDLFLGKRLSHCQVVRQKYSIIRRECVATQQCLSAIPDSYF